MYFSYRQFPGDGTGTENRHNSTSLEKRTRILFPPSGFKADAVLCWTSTFSNVEALKIAAGCGVLRNPGPIKWELVWSCCLLWCHTDLLLDISEDMQNRTRSWMFWNESVFPVNTVHVWPVAGHNQGGLCFFWQARVSPQNSKPPDTNHRLEDCC